MLIQTFEKHCKDAYFTKYNNLIINENNGKSNTGFIHYTALQYSIVALNSRLLKHKSNSLKYYMCLYAQIFKYLIAGEAT